MSLQLLPAAEVAAEVEVAVVAAPVYLVVFRPMLNRRQKFARSSLNLKFLR
jgi:hypothetical protein